MEKNIQETIESLTLKVQQYYEENPLIIKGGLVGLIIFVLILNWFLSSKANSSSSSGKRKRELTLKNPNTNTEPQPKLFTPAPISIPTSPPSTPDVSMISSDNGNNSPSTPEREALRLGALHNGTLKKRSIWNKTINKFELFREDERNVVIAYTDTKQTGSPSNSKKASKMYIGPETWVEKSSSDKAFTVHQLKKGGKILKLEAPSIQERDQWITRIEEVVKEFLPKN